MKTQGKRLTNKQKAFVAEYQKDYNATRAVIAAGYSEKSAKELGYELLHIPLLKQMIERRQEERLRKVGVHAERILTETARVALSDLRNIYNDNGTLKPPHEWSDETAAAIAGVETLEEFAGKGKDRRVVGHTRKVRTYDKTKALELLSKHLGLIERKRHDEDEDELQRRVLTTLEISAKIIYLVKLANERKQLESQGEVEDSVTIPT